MLAKLFVIAGVVLLAVPAFVLGCRGAGRRSGLSTDERADRTSYALLVALRVLTLALLLALSALLLLSGVGALVRDVDLHGMVWVFFVLDLLVATSVLLTFGRRERRPARRRAPTAAR
ncbi:hypothetical protein OF117_19695 [Geodermatophilus sp. YIM 151500]|uniref:hypothetical protein n=1 Tax=Geodermatophilus sp. YIM 151500 TaxID=2984531 RepID=UPI0021E38D68|nr:hypothetical protein [Geodermatophilus sp. YIM 151500]MCV2491573.1 hypothetical protein [Geodermatophilus sp. YIM 151500]